MKLIVGLGNIGREYENTRHNIGFMVVDELARRLGVSFGKEDRSAYMAEYRAPEKIIIIKPTTYMNLSGVAVGAYANFYHIDPDDIAVIQDDMDMPVGQLRIRRKGSAGGHNGIKSIIGNIGQDFPRVKIGVGEKPRPELQDGRDAIVRVTLGSICTSDLHIKHGSVPRAVPGITVGHEMVGVVEEVGHEVTSVKPGDRVTVNVETFCGECFFCRHGYVNNCTDPHGGWALGCRIDGGQAEFVRVPYADQGLNVIPPSVTDEQALFVGDILATGFWAARISEIKEEDTVLIIGAGPTGICTLQCVMLKNPHRVIVCERSEERLRFVREHYPGVEVTTPEGCKDFVLRHSAHGGADVVLEVAGSQDSFRLAWECARPNAIVTIVALYDKPQLLPLPDMYGKNLTFKTGGVDGCDCAEILSLIEAGRIDTTPLVTHRFPLERIEEAYRIFENRLDGVIKVAVTGRER